MNIWIRLASLAVLAAALAACSRESSQADSVQPIADADKVPAAVTPMPAEGKPLNRPLAKGVDLSFSHDLRSDRIQETKPGVYHRRVLLEYLALDQQQVATALIAAMSAGGYEVASNRTDDTGRIRLTFKKGKRKITARIRHGGKLHNSAASGAMMVSIPAKAPKSGKDDTKPVAGGVQSSN